MFSRLIHVNDYLEIGAIEHYGSLLLCKTNAELRLPPISKWNNFVFSVLPIEGSTVTLSVSDSESTIDAGHGLTKQAELTEQRIHTLISAGRWLVTR